MNLIITGTAMQKLYSIAGLECSDNIDMVTVHSTTPVAGIKRLRIEVKGGGCSGYQYIYSVDDCYDNNDIVFDHGDCGVVIDTDSAQFLKDVTIDYVIDLGGEYFQIKNPNVNNRCGCGNSFSF